MSGMTTSPKVDLNQIPVATQNCKFYLNFNQ